MNMVNKLKSFSKVAVFVYGLFMLIQNYVIGNWPSGNDKTSTDLPSDSLQSDTIVYIVHQDSAKIDTIVK